MVSTREWKDYLPTFSFIEHPSLSTLVQNLCNPRGCKLQAATLLPTYVLFQFEIGITRFKVFANRSMAARMSVYWTCATRPATLNAEVLS